MKKNFGLMIIITAFILMISCSKTEQVGEFDIALITEGKIDINHIIRELGKD